MNKTNKTKLNPLLLQEYKNIIANVYSKACFKEASRLLKLYFNFLKTKTPSTENFPSFFIRFRDLKPNSRARYYAYYSGFFKWYSGENLPFKVRMARVEPQLVSDDEIELLRKTLYDKLTHRHILERDLLILDTMVMTGIRRGELVNLKVKDIYSNNGKTLLFVRNGKGAKDRIIPLNPTIASSLHNYISERNIKGRVFPISASYLSVKINT